MFGAQNTNMFGTQPTATFGGGQQTATFGTQPTNTFGGGQPTATFGTQPTNTFGGGQPASSFGTNTTSMFGTPQQGAQTTSLFGTSQPQQQATSFGTPGLFGSTQPQQQGTQSTSLFATPQQQGTQSASIFGTSQPQQQGTGFSMFGSTQPQQQATGFGTSGLFGSTQQQPTMSLFGTSQPQQQGTGFSMFGTSQQQQQQQQQQQMGIDEQAAFHQSIFGCCKFGDERDAILANLNYVQACWGGGKGYYNQTNPPVSYNDKNVIYRFKAVVYSFMYTESNEDGNVVIHIKKPQSKVAEEETGLIQNLQTMLNKPNIFFKISGTKALSEDLTVIVLTADDRSTLRRILATELAQALQQPQFRPQLDNMGIVSVYAKVKPSPEQLKAYLDNAPAGLDPRVWKKAQEDNPDPDNMIPLPILGPDALKSRIEAQQKENQQHSSRLRLISDEVTHLHNRHSNMSAELQQLRHRNTMLTHRIISAIVRMQIIQKQGLPLQPEEEELKKQIQHLEKQLNSPTHFKGRLNELMSHVRLHKSSLENRGLVKYSVDGSTLDQVKEFLNLQQGSIMHLVETVKASMDYVRRMNEDLVEFSEKQANP